MVPACPSGTPGTGRWCNGLGFGSVCHRSRRTCLRLGIGCSCRGGRVSARLLRGIGSSFPVVARRLVRSGDGLWVCGWEAVGVGVSGDVVPST
ncbi:MAG: hypothetical protein ABGY24_16090, partial [bacterium]